MPFTFSAGSFTFLKSSTTASQIDNNVDNVNKNNINVNDNLEIGNNCLPLANTLNVIPLERSRSLDNPRNNTGGNQKNSNNRKAWYKSLFVRIHHTLSPSRWSTDDGCNNNKINNNSIINNTVDDNNIKPGERDEIGNVDDDDPIMMKSTRSVVPEIKKNTFVRHGHFHDFYVETKDYNNLKDDLLKPSQVRSNTFDGAFSSTTFEKCAQTPRHFAKEAEVLGKVGRFTIVREREDFDTTYFDQCHCQQKPCRFSTNGCSGTHPILPPESLPQLCNKNKNNNHHQAAAIAHQQSIEHNSWSSSSRPRSSLYCNPVPYSNSSRHSLPPLQNNTNNGMISVPIVASKVSAAAFTNCRGILSQSASSPNLVHLNQRIKSENIVNKHPTSRNNNNGRLNVSNNIIVSGKNQSNNGSYYPQSTTNSSVVKKVKKPSLINMKSTEFVLHHTSSTTNSPSTSTPPTPTYPSKFSHHNSNEPHTTINSHSGRKFEVEWSSSLTTTSSSTSSTSSTSSSDPSPSPSSTISSVFSMGSSPDKSTTSTLSRRCSTLSSKCGRKFEVTILSSSGNGNNSLLNISPHSTINNTIVSSPVETEFTKC
jgi:hypothetical protein